MDDDGFLIIFGFLIGFLVGMSVCITVFYISSDEGNLKNAVCEAKFGENYTSDHDFSDPYTIKCIRKLSEKVDGFTLLVDDLGDGG